MHHGQVGGQPAVQAAADVLRCRGRVSGRQAVPAIPQIDGCPGTPPADLSQAFFAFPTGSSWPRPPPEDGAFLMFIGRVSQATAKGHSCRDPQRLDSSGSRETREPAPLTLPQASARAIGYLGAQGCSALSPHLELAEGVAAIQVLVLAVHLQGVVLRLLHQRLPEHCGLLPEGTGHQGQGHVLGGHLEGEALLGGGGRVRPPPC